MKKEKRRDNVKAFTDDDRRSYAKKSKEDKRYEKHLKKELSKYITK